MIGEQVCGKCGYSLKGLPDVHACPECGLDYDRISMLYNLHPLRTIPIYAFWAGWGIFLVLAHGPSRSETAVLGVILAIVVVSTVNAGLRFLFWLPHWLAVNREGVHLLYIRRPKRTVTWADLRQVRLDYGRIRILDREGKRPITLSFSLVGGSEAARAISFDICRLARAYALMEQRRASRSDSAEALAASPAELQRDNQAE